MASNVRKNVLTALVEWETSQKDILFAHPYTKDLDARDRAFAKRLTEGCLERQIELDYLLDQASKTPIRTQKPLIRCLLRMSLYQILYMDAVPNHAAISEAQKCADHFHFSGLKPYISGILHHFARHKDTLRYPDPQKDLLYALSVKVSIPQWILRLWLEAYGEEILLPMVESFFTPRPVTVTFHTKLTPMEQQAYLDQWRELGVGIQRGAYVPHCYELTHLFGVDALPGFLEGAFYVQDQSSALAVQAAGIRPGDLVVDICAAPGGKTIAAAMLGARVLSRDVSDRKIQRLQENITRLSHIPSPLHITTQIWNAQETDESLLGKADVVLMDVPCSGLGVMGKKPDLKYRLTPEGIASLQCLQKEIVAHSWQYLKPGGILLYSTCTLNPAENEEMIAMMTTQFPLDLVSLSSDLPKEIRAAASQTGSIRKGSECATEVENACVTLFPGFFETDGFFFAKMQRRYT
ncbi:MAG: 16S rRNA (cytosine(967)-C(5))-methyltransferase RsmB [Lachnospiraceae bacterium]|jgi:16S rRNA (cytosine967-C5)-methyltransferase|nr:16S rRNA (cytosine(967)-C(5))-methyltransferase RsmB [Lachnospiraceae bacterium]